MSGLKEEDDFPYVLIYARVIPKMIGPLTRTGISPSYVTLLSIILTTLGCLTLVSEIVWILRVTLVVILLQISVLLDCLDGALARASQKTSRFGAWFDQIADRIKEFLLILSISYYYHMLATDPSIWILGFFTLFTVTLFHYAGDAGTAVPKTVMQEYVHYSKLKVMHYIHYFVPNPGPFNLFLSLCLIFNIVPLGYILLSIACATYAIMRGIVSWRLVKNE